MIFVEKKTFVRSTVQS